MAEVTSGYLTQSRIAASQMQSGQEDAAAERWAFGNAMGGDLADTINGNGRILSPRPVSYSTSIEPVDQSGPQVDLQRFISGLPAIATGDTTRYADAESRKYDPDELLANGYPEDAEFFAPPVGKNGQSIGTVASGRGTLMFDRDEPGIYVSRVRAAVANPAPGTSNTASTDLVANYGSTFDKLIAQGSGSTVFGQGEADNFDNNSFNIRPFPEESLNNVNDPTYHKYGLLTYFGPVDESLGITKDFMVRDVLQHRYSYPGLGLAPVVADFSGNSQVYAVAPYNIANIDNPDSYTYRIGVIQQMMVPDGVLNITTDNHDVYPGTIRRTVIERDGQLFMFTSGAGENNYNNIGAPRGAGALISPTGEARLLVETLAAAGNDKYGPQAFRTLDHKAFEYVQSIRNGKK